MFVEVDVVAGDRLFTIDEPIFLVVCYIENTFFDENMEHAKSC